jgi:hypothetical protein
MKKNIFNKLGIFGLLLGAMASASSCQKELPSTEANQDAQAFVAVHNYAIRVPSNITVNLNNNNLLVLGAQSSIAYNASLSGPYAGVTPGSTTVAVRTLTGTADLASRTVPLAAASATSFFAYDTLSPTNTIKMVALNNDTRVPASGTSNVRMLNFAPNVPTSTITLTRTADGFGVAATGTSTFSNVNYVGSVTTPNETALSAYTNIPSGTYTLVVTVGGTSVFSTAAFTVRDGKSYSWILRGFGVGHPNIGTFTLGGATILHNP